MADVTSKHEIPYAEGTDLIDQWPALSQEIAERLDAILARHEQGLLANRPAAGISGRFYRATDTGQVFLDTGSAWQLVGADVGDLKATARSTAPDGWLLCDGAAVSRTTYAALFDAIGTTYGTGNGSTTFNLPDLRGRVPVGVDGAAGRLSANDALGQSGGSQTHTLTTSEMPSHSHTIAARLPTSGLGNANVAMSSEASNGVAVTNPQGGGSAHNNMQPYQVVNWIIKY